MDIFGIERYGMYMGIIQEIVILPALRTVADGRRAGRDRRLFRGVQHRGGAFCRGCALHVGRGEAAEGSLAQR